jgi:hypothetical protein
MPAYSRQIRSLRTRYGCHMAGVAAWGVVVGECVTSAELVMGTCFRRKETAVLGTGIAVRFEGMLGCVPAAVCVCVCFVMSCVCVGVRFRGMLGCVSAAVCECVCVCL